MVTQRTLNTREDWLQIRGKSIGGSDAACIIGANPWRTNRELWEILKGYRQAEDISENQAVKYGTEAEEHLRALFALDYPEMQIEYEENNIWTNDRFPFAHASLDGWLTDADGRRGVLEIKTSTINGAAQKAKWDGKIPLNYYAQVLHYLLITEAEFAIVKAKLRYTIQGAEPFSIIRHYRIERAEVTDDLDFLEQEERRFAEILNGDTPPDIILPEI